MPQRKDKGMMKLKIKYDLYHPFDSYEIQVRYDRLKSYTFSKDQPLHLNREENV